jgi:SAM-dependent methyltransferase
MTAYESPEESHVAYAGQAPYTPLNLRGYDFSVYRISSPLLWRCSKEKYLGLYNEHVSARHLDVGVASGALLDECRFPVADPDVTLMDLNPSSLEFAQRRLSRYAPRIHQGNVLEPWGLPADRFGSVALMNILHCVPGTMRDKAVAFENASSVLVPGGTLFGCTVLGRGVKHTRRSQWALNNFNRKGAFCNLDDSLEDLEEGLSRVFPSSRVEVVGVMGLFVATAPE